MPLFEDDLRPCRFCGTPCDGDVCSDACLTGLYEQKEAEDAAKNAEADARLSELEAEAAENGWCR